MAKKTNYERIIEWFLVLGAFNWGLVGLFGFNLVNTLLGAIPFAETIAYIMVGGAGALYLINMIDEMN